MKTITIIGWNEKDKVVREAVSTWPDEMDVLVAIARASREADVVTVEEVLAEDEAKDEVEMIPVEEVFKKGEPTG